MLWGYHYMDGFGGMFISMFFWVLIICGALYLIQGGSKNYSNECKKKEGPIDILKRRYASGEINSEEFARMKKDLET